MVEEAINPYSRLVSWEVWNFMSIGHAKVDFDERNIINLKGYNDSGKSAMLWALKILMSNSSPTKQVGFIHDGCDYFRVLANFDDGVQILRDKYINGQSLYEMYKDGDLLYSSKSGKTLTRITEVPKPIADYLGLIMFDGVCLNARACFEKQIGVQTTGSENYKMFNTVLKSEEIAMAGTLLNNDKNKLSSDINVTDNELQSYKNLLGDKDGLTQEMIDYLKSHDSCLDSIEFEESDISHINDIIEKISNVPEYPEVAAIDNSQLNDLSVISLTISTLDSIKIAPEVDFIDTERLSSIKYISDLNDSLNSISLPPEVATIDGNRLSDLVSIQSILNQLDSCSKLIDDSDAKLKIVSDELVDLQKQVTEYGIKMVRCPSCGQIFDPEKEHLH